MRIFLQKVFRRGQFHGIQKMRDFFLHIFLVGILLDHKRITKNFNHPPHRVQGSIGILLHHLNVVPVFFLLFLIHLRHFRALKKHFSRGWMYDAGDYICHRCLSASALSHENNYFSGIYGQINIVQCIHIICFSEQPRLFVKVDLYMG